MWRFSSKPNECRVKAGCWVLSTYSSSPCSPLLPLCADRAFPSQVTGSALLLPGALSPCHNNLCHSAALWIKCTWSCFLLCFALGGEDAVTVGQPETRWKKVEIGRNSTATVKNSRNVQQLQEAMSSNSTSSWNFYSGVCVRALSASHLLFMFL